MTEPKPSRAKNITYAVMAGQSGCASVILIMIALFIGLWLDSRFGIRGPFTVGLLLLSIPISLFVMVRIALGMIDEIKPPVKKNVQQDLRHTEEE